MVPPPAGCGWHTSAEYGASSRPVFSSASSRPAGPCRSSAERTCEVASDRACEPAEVVIVPSSLLRRRAGYPVLHMPIDAIDLTRKLVNIESISYHEGAAGAVLADFLAAQGYAVERMAVEQPDLARTPGGGEGPRFNVYAAMPGITPDVVFSDRTFLPPRAMRSSAWRWSSLTWRALPEAAKDRASTSTRRCPASLPM